MKFVKETDKNLNLPFFANQVVEGFITGLHKSPYHGFSVEFAEHRLYNTGESTRHIDWKLFGRTDKLFVKKYEEETNLRCQMIIDISSSMHYPNFENPCNTTGNFRKIRFFVMKKNPNLACEPSLLFNVHKRCGGNYTTNRAIVNGILNIFGDVLTTESVSRVEQIG